MGRYEGQTLHSHFALCDANSSLTVKKRVFVQEDLLIPHSVDDLWMGLKSEAENERVATLYGPDEKDREQEVRDFSPISAKRVAWIEVNKDN